MKERYDVIVIGAGIGGLTAGALLAHRGYSVAVFEAGSVPGGYCTSFRRGGYRFDSVLDAVSGCGDGGWLRTVLEQHLGVWDMVEMLRLDPLRVDLFGSERIAVPGRLDELIELLCSMAPSGREGILSLFELMEEAYRAAMALPPEMLYTDPRIEERGGALARCRGVSFGHLLDGYVKDARVRAVLSDRCAFMGLPPSKVSALAMVVMFMTYAVGGGYRIKGGAQRLSDALVAGLTKEGGELYTRSEATAVHGRDGRAAGVAVEGKLVRARAVVSAASASATARLAGLDLGQERLKPSVSYFMVYLGLSRELDMPHCMGVYPGFDIEGTFADIASDIASPRSSLEIINYSGVSPEMAPAGGMSVMLMAKAAHGYKEDWHSCKKREMERLIAKADGAVPGLRDAVAFAEAATPRTLERYTGNTAGAAFGWEQDVPNRRTPSVTGMPGLFTAGHWTYPGGGIESVAASGIMAAEHVAGYLARAGR